MSCRSLFIPVIAVGVVFWVGSALAAQPAPVASTSGQAARSLTVAAVSPKAAAQTKKSAAKQGGKKVEVDMNKLFPPGKGRDLVLDNCMSCHSMAPIVVAQKTRGEWTQLGASHRDAAAQLSDEQYKQLLEYLIANFNPSHPVPELPEELLSGWTNY